MSPRTATGKKNAPEHDLPPIELDTSSTELQLRISKQSWSQVSARHPPGSIEHPPDSEALAEFASSILERRLTDVVRYRREAKLADKSVSSSASSLDGGGGGVGFINGGTFKKGDLLDALLLEDKKKTSSSSSSVQHDNDRILLTSRCRSQLRKFVKHVASKYHDNKYHGLEHAVHVTMSANKLLEMIHDGSVENTLDSSSEDFMASEPYLKAGLQDLSDSDSFIRNGSKFSTKAAAASSSSSKKSPPSAPDEQHPSHSYSDTFAKFAFVFAAFIHDVDHQGVPNARLVAEDDPICTTYGRISVAEKHSIKVAFRTLNESDYDEFRSAVYETNEEKLRLHRIIHSLVLSTDIASPERMRETKKRWHEAFSRPVPDHGPLAFSRLSLAGKYSATKEIATVQASKLQLVACDVDNTRKKEGKYEARGELLKRRNSMTRTLQMEGGQTVEYFASSSDEDDIKVALRHSVMLETMLNVADVAHATQAWELFCFWNRKLYEELYGAFKAGRSDNDPSAEWYQNELDFFRLYIIPLSEKLKKSGMFGDRGEEWINNALRIRDRWKSEGEQVTQAMIDAVRKDFE